MIMSQADYQAWPTLPYDQFKDTAYLLHRISQIIGKLKLTTPFEPHWANVALLLTSRGISTGLIPYRKGCFSFDLDMIDHYILLTTSFGDYAKLPLKNASVASTYQAILRMMQNANITLSINPMPQEIANPIAFDKDETIRNYDKELANAWWRILISSYKVMQAYHAKFTGRTPPIGLMWGTFDLRDARYMDEQIPTTGPNAGYIRRNAMDAPQVEAGFWCGNEIYPKPAYFSFIYPQPDGVAQSKIMPKTARWENTLGEFILDYDDVRTAQDPDQALASFLESTYQVEAKHAGWNQYLIGKGEPI